MNRFFLSAALAALAFGLAGCGGNDTESADAGTQVQQPDASAPAAVSCSIVSPAADALVSGNVDVQVQFAGPVTKIEILDGDRSVGSLNVTGASPATVPVDTTALAEGTRSLKAKATSADNSAESAAVSVVVDNAAPKLSMALTYLSILTGTAMVPMVATEPHLAKLQLLEGDTVLVELTTIPDDLPWDTTAVEDGLHTVKLSATDTLGHTTVTAEQTIIVGNHATTPVVTYDPAALVTIPTNWQSVEIDVRGMVENPGGVTRILTWLEWDPAQQMNLEYALGTGLCPHRGIKFTSSASRDGFILIDQPRTTLTADVVARLQTQATNSGVTLEDTTFPDDDSELTLGLFFGHIAVLDAADHVGQSVPVTMHFVLFN